MASSPQSSQPRRPDDAAPASRLAAPSPSRSRDFQRRAQRECTPSGVSAAADDRALR